MGLRETIEAAVSQIRTARYGRDVRSAIATGIESNVQLMTTEAIRLYKGIEEPGTTAAVYPEIKLNDIYMKMTEYDSETESGEIEKIYYCSRVATNRAGSPIYVEWTQIVTVDSIPQDIPKNYEVEVSSTSLEPSTALEDYPGIKDYDVCYTFVNAAGIKVINGMYSAKISDNRIEWTRIPRGLDSVVQNTNNAVQNFAVKAYVDNAIANLKDYVDEHIGG